MKPLMSWQQQRRQRQPVVSENLQIVFIIINPAATTDLIFRHRRRCYRHRRRNRRSGRCRRHHHRYRRH